MQSAVEMQLAYQNLQTIIQRLRYKTFIQMLVLAISSQKNTLNGILSNITLVQNEKKLNSFWTKIGDFGHSTTANKTKQTTNRAKFFL